MRVKIELGEVGILLRWGFEDLSDDFLRVDLS